MANEPDARAHTTARWCSDDCGCVQELLDLNADPKRYDSGKWKALIHNPVGFTQENSLPLLRTEEEHLFSRPQCLAHGVVSAILDQFPAVSMGRRQDCDGQRGMWIVMLTYHFNLFEDFHCWTAHNAGRWTLTHVACSNGVIAMVKLLLGDPVECSRGQAALQSVRDMLSL